MSEKLSVVISVGKGPGLQPPLPGAYTGHAEYKAWAQSQGHDVVEFTDEFGGVFTAVDIANAIKTPISAQSLSELWIYFAGHGECSAIQTDYWILRRDGAGPGDVIDVAKTRRLATLLGVPRVIIIADACRTTGDLQSMSAQENAVSILPSLSITALTPSVECLFATQPGSPSLEVREENAKAHGIFTTVLMRALRGEVPSVHTRSDDGTKLVVRLRELRIYLEEHVPAQAAALGKGRAQRPNVIEGGSRDPYAHIGNVPNLDVRIDTVTEDGAPASGTMITLTLHRGMTDFSKIGELPGPTAHFSVPSGCIYESTATGPFSNLRPETPLPLFRLDSAKHGRYVAIENPQNHKFEATGGVTSPGTALPSIAITRVIADDGGLHSRAPGAGIYPVVTYDALTAQLASQLQRFTDDDLVPKPISTWVDDAVKDQIVAAAKVHGRRGFETGAGLTLIGIAANETPDIAAPPGLGNAVFLEDGNWQVRANHTGGVVIRLGESFAPLPIFSFLVGAVRIVRSGSEHQTVEDISYAPATHSRYEHDLDMFSGRDNLIAEGPRDEIDALQLIATRCARNGFFEVAIDESVGLAERMRQLKHHNPVFGVIAGYAFDMAGRQDQIVDMIKWFVHKEQPIPFDLAMLSGLSEQQLLKLIDTTEKCSNGEYANQLKSWICPTWPMLTQGWGRLSEEHLHQFPILAEASKSLVPGFWTMLAGSAGEQFFAHVNEGKMQWI